jgi:hypothetical protein
VDYFGVPGATVNENHEEQGQTLGHPDELVTLLPVTLDEVLDYSQAQLRRSVHHDARVFGGQQGG